MEELKWYPEGIKEPIRRYALIELSCAERQCNPCVYPHCQRWVMEQKNSKTIHS